MFNITLYVSAEKCPHIDVDVPATVGASLLDTQHQPSCNLIGLSLPGTEFSQTFYIKANAHVSTHFSLPQVVYIHQV